MMKVLILRNYSIPYYHDDMISTISSDLSLFEWISYTKREYELLQKYLRIQDSCANNHMKHPTCHWKYVTAENGIIKIQTALHMRQGRAMKTKIMTMVLSMQMILFETFHEKRKSLLITAILGHSDWETTMAKVELNWLLWSRQWHLDSQNVSNNAHQYDSVEILRHGCIMAENARRFLKVTSRY